MLDESILKRQLAGLRPLLLSEVVQRQQQYLLSVAMLRGPRWKGNLRLVRIKAPVRYVRASTSHAEESS